MKERGIKITNIKGNKLNPVLGAVDYSTITLCPALGYDCYCQMCCRCEYCPYYKTNDGENCEGCGANFKHQENPKAKYNCA